MKDLTQGSITRHVFEMAVPVAVGLIVQTLYFLVDLYFVARLGDAAIAGVGAGGNVNLIVIGLTQVLGVGTTALIAHAVGRRDRDEANLVFNQSVLLSAGCGLLFVVGGYALAGAYMSSLGATAATVAAGTTYLRWFIPGLALQFALVAMTGALRGTGVVKPTMLVQVFTVLLNAVLAPVLIAGWGTGHRLGVAGAGLASSISVAAGVTLLVVYFLRLEKYVAIHGKLLTPRVSIWRRMFAVGLPAGGEFALIFVYTSVIYAIIRSFGAEAQAGFGIGMRVMQALFLPVMALAFAAAPIAGQNFAAGHAGRVRATFTTSAAIGSALMLSLTLFCQWRPDWLIGRFAEDGRVVAVGAQFLKLISLNFVATGLIFTCSSMFQGLGNTWPSLISSATRLLIFVGPAIALSTRPQFQLTDVWHLSVATMALQALMSLFLLRRELRRHLAGPLPLQSGAV